MLLSSILDFFHCFTFLSVSSDAILEKSLEHLNSSTPVPTEGDFKRGPKTYALISRTGSKLKQEQVRSSQYVIFDERVS